MRELISVIVPVYKVEKYLDRCVSSIVNQTYKNLEIILVDDGSPDSCPEMCEEWAKKDGRIKVVHKENGGLSDARNAGLAVARGEYISFIDSDDWISEDFYRVLYDTLARTGADLAECDFVTTAGDEPADRGSGKVYTKNTLEAMESHLKDGMFRQVVWNKLYKRSVITAEFDKGKYHEDVFWTYKIIASCKTLAHVERDMYFYFQREDSIMGAGYSLKRLDAIEAGARRVDYISEKFPALNDCAREMLLYSCIYHGQLVLRFLTGTEKKESFNYIRSVYRKYRLCGKSMRRLPIKPLIWFSMGRISFSGICRLRNMLNIGY